MVYTIQNYVQRMGGWNPPKIGKFKHIDEARKEAIKKSIEWADHPITHRDFHGASVIILKDGAQIGYVDAYGPKGIMGGVAVYHTWTKSNTGYIIDSKGKIVREW